MGDAKGWVSLVAAVMASALFLRLISSGASSVYDNVTRGVFVVSLAVLLGIGVVAAVRLLRR